MTSMLYVDRVGGGGFGVTDGEGAWLRPDGRKGFRRRATVAHSPSESQAEGRGHAMLFRRRKMRAQGHRRAPTEKDRAHPAGHGGVCQPQPGAAVTARARVAKILNPVPLAGGMAAQKRRYSLVPWFLGSGLASAEAAFQGGPRRPLRRGVGWVAVALSRSHRSSGYREAAARCHASRRSWLVVPGASQKPAGAAARARKARRGRWAERNEGGGEKRRNTSGLS